MLEKVDVVGSAQPYVVVVGPAHLVKPTAVRRHEAMGNGDTTTSASTELDLSELEAFGRITDREGYPAVRLQTGGFIDLGRGPSVNLSPGKENWSHVGREAAESSEGGRPAARQGEGRRAPTRQSARQASYPVGDRLAEKIRFEELLRWYPYTRVLGSFSNLTLLSTPVGVLRSLPYRARLLFEVPHEAPYLAFPDHYNKHWNQGNLRQFVPDVRVWAMWNSGVLPQAYHRYPDRSICAFMKGEWVLDDEPLSTYLDWCVYWLGRALHLEFFDHWPGRQHCPSVVRVERNRPDDYCGCGSNMRWRECCMAEDLSRSRYDLVMEQWRANANYLSEVRRRSLPVEPPWKR